jgi:hypothetical protein
MIVVEIFILFLHFYKETDGVTNRTFTPTKKETESEQFGSSATPLTVSVGKYLDNTIK